MAKTTPKPEALPTDIFGQYLFANDRKDIKAVEDNTAEEDSVGGDFIEYYEDNKQPALAKRMPELFALLKAGKYKPLLAPPKMMVYRGLNIGRTKIDALLKKKKLPTLQQQFKLTGDETPARIIVGPGKMEPVKSPLQGWSMSPEIAITFSGWTAWSSDTIPVLFIANPARRGNMFLGNPKVYDTLNPDIDDERETLSYGTVIYDKIVIAPVVNAGGYSMYKFDVSDLRVLGLE